MVGHKIQIRNTEPAQLEAVLKIHREAFGQAVEADLVQALLVDPTARPHLSLLASIDGRPAGHVLFTNVSLDATGDQPAASILCPLAVLPDHQRRGAGAMLIRTGLQRLAETGSDLVFVFGDPAYYGRFGFTQADFNRFPTPHPIPDAYRPGWMVQTLSDASRNDFRGQIVCAEALNKPEFWVA